MDARFAWIKFGAVLAGSIVGGFGLGCLLASVIAKRLWEEAMP